MNFDLEVAHRITNLRESQNMTQAQLAKSIGLDRTKLNKIEKGTRRALGEELTAIAKALHTSTDYILGKEISKNGSNVSETDLDEMLDNAHSYDGKPLDDHDRELIRQYLKALLNK